ncbi:hypothetical protein [Anaerorhabdus sp.]|uniref:hypothetical protein n=1 Tax=Anaerorhabdus sp. TaxID=1872524 RepID=UPI002FC949B0
MLVALLVFVALAAGYGALYYMNHKTPVPAGCEDLKADCEGCKVTSCEIHPVHDISKGEEKND